MNERLKQMSIVLSKQIKAKSLLRMNEGIMKYIGLRNNRYFLNISKEKCKQIGISPLEYERVVVDLEKTNRFIAEVEKNGKRGIDRNISLAKEQVKLKGTIYTNGQEERGEGVWVPEGYNSVHFECWTNAAIGAGYTCKVKNFGATKVKTITGTKFNNAIVDIPLDASNASAGIYFCTTDPNGGHASWELRK